MAITVERAAHPGGIVCLTVHPRTTPGEAYDVEPADSIPLERAIARELAAGNARLLFDMEGARHVYSSAMWAIVAAGAAARARGGRVVLVTRSPTVTRFLELTSAHDDVEYQPDLPSGLKACAA